MTERRRELRRSTEERWNMELSTKYLYANGLRFRVYDEGGGEPVLLLHGLPDSLDLWRHIIPTFLDAGYRVIAFDQRGFGQSDAPVGVSNYKYSNMIDDAASILAQLRVHNRVKLVGHDHGAGVGWRLATYRPELISSYVAISIGHPASLYGVRLEELTRQWYVMCFLLGEGFAEELFSANDWAVFQRWSVYHPEWPRWKKDLEREGRFTAGLNWYRANVGDRAEKVWPKIEVPVLGIWSDGDPYTTERQMLDSEQYTAGGFEYRRIDECSHWIPLDKPDELSPIILDYWRRIG